MANLTPEQEAINRSHNSHQSRHIQFDPDCRECIRQRSWQPPTSECNWCEERLPLNDTQAIISHNEYHMRRPDSITK